jgi:hypothetical protein
MPAWFVRLFPFGGVVSDDSDESIKKAGYLFQATRRSQGDPWLSVPASRQVWRFLINRKENINMTCLCERCFDV